VQLATLVGLARIGRIGHGGLQPARSGKMGFFPLAPREASTYVLPRDLG
jgi:hypothetical protein